MITVIDHAMAWLAPSKTLARSIHHHAGAWIMRNGTGRANNHPATRIGLRPMRDRKSTRLNSSHVSISYAVFCLKKKKKNKVEWVLVHDTSNEYQDTRN